MKEKEKKVGDKKIFTYLSELIVKKKKAFELDKLIKNAQKIKKKLEEKKADVFMFISV